MTRKRGSQLATYQKMFPTHFLLFKNLTGNNCKSERGEIIDGAATTTGYGMTH